MNKKLPMCLLLLLLLAKFSSAQFTENFNDGNFTTNPKWVGNSSSFLINTSLQLQSNNSTANTIYYLSTPNTLATSAQWEFYTKLTFNTSGANYVDVYLTASDSNISKPATTGYFVRIGSTNDDICLYRKNINGTITKIIDGINGILNTSNNVIKIKVTRDATNLWTLSRDITGTGSRYFIEGNVTDATYTTSAYFGILIKQSTASFFQRHFFDDIMVKPYVPDITPPLIQSVMAISATSVDVLFDEPVNIGSQIISNYTANNNLGNPISATQDVSNPALIHLFFANKIPNGTLCILTIKNVKDIAGNTITNASTATFSFFLAQQYDIVIDEIMADPTPQVGLPNAKWIELKNTSKFSINLQGFTIGDSVKQSGAFPIFILQPDSFVIVCASSAAQAMSTFGAAISVSNFITLNNSNGEIILSNAEGKTIHAVNYSSSWFVNTLKQQGGWSLEMIDTKNPCSGYSNWKASIDETGGTPAKKNSVDGNNIDDTPPKLLRAFAADNMHITLYFDEPLDSTKASVASNYSINENIGMPQNAIAVGPFFDKVNLKLTTPLLLTKTYTITATSVTDCAGNVINYFDTARVGISSSPNNFDVVINEILFNPKDNGVDYVELYNRSKKIINLKQLNIANRNTAGNISSIARLTTDNYLLFPQSFMVVTSNPLIVKSQYLAKNPDAFLQVINMPSFNDDNGDVILLNNQGNIIDELQYNANWQFKLIDNVQGVALERIDYNAPTQFADNWHSAATDIGYGTPSYKNSQYRIDQYTSGQITVYPEIFSPNNDGIDDFVTIDYTFPTPGYTATITIFNATGQQVRSLQNNALCGTQGRFMWDGLGEKNNKLITGIYIVYTKVFDLTGKTKSYKNVVVLANNANN